MVPETFFCPSNKKFLESIGRLAKTQSSETTEEPDEYTQQGLEDLRRARQLIMDDYSEKLKQRELFADRIFYFMVFWCLFVIVLVFSVAKHFAWLPESVLTAIIYGTTAQVIGLFFLVVKFVFSNRMPGDGN